MRKIFIIAYLCLMLAGAAYALRIGSGAISGDGFFGIQSGGIDIYNDPTGGGVASTDALLLENGDYLLLETGDKLLLE